MAGLEIDQHIVQQIAQAGPVIEMVMRVYDRLAWVKSRFGTQRQPVRADWRVLRM
jgi:hypothetical protein